MNKLIGLKEFRSRVGEIAARVNRGESFVVLKKSKPVFKISPLSDDEQWEEVIDFTKIKKGGINIKQILSRIKRLERRVGLK